MRSPARRFQPFSFSLRGAFQRTPRCSRAKVGFRFSLRAVGSTEPEAAFSTNNREQITNNCAKAGGFTLVELTAVILIIAILAGLLFTAASSMLARAKKTQAKNDVTQIVSAVNAYYTEYGKYPVNVTTSTTTDAFFGTGTTLAGCTSYGNNDVLFDVLTNNTGNPSNATTVTALNPRGIVFLNAPVAKSITKPRSGVIPNGATVTAPLRVGVWYDPWGSPYAVACDTTYDNKLGTANPYSDTDFSAGPSPLQLGAIAYSYGRNGALGGGAAVSSGFGSESGTAGKFKGSSDILSWQ